MPIVGRTPEEALNKFCAHVNHLLSTTLTRERLSPVSLAKGLQVAFRKPDGSPREVRLNSRRFGDLGFYLGHVCDTVEDAPNRHRLRSISYNYRLSVLGNTEPFVRWEYVKFPTPPTATWARHHLQGPIDLHIGDRSVPFNKLHLPTGWITIEDVIRFCIDDLHVRPLTASWHQRLEDSYRMFRTEFVGPLEP